MKAWIGVLTFLLAAGVLTAETTNVVEILRRFQAQLDAKERGEVLEPAPEAGREAAGGGGAKEVVAPEPKATAVAKDSTETVASGERRLRSGDVLKVEVLDEPDLSTNRVTVAEQGTIRLPLLGEVKLAGKTLKEATETIRQALEKDYLVDPRVKMALVEEAWPAAIVVPRAPPAERVPELVSGSELAGGDGSCAFTIEGMVRNPGSYRWSCDQQMSLLRAIGMAGGTAPNADTSRLTIRRREGDKRKEIIYDLRSRGPELGRPLPLLEPGDEVSVPRK